MRLQTRSFQSRVARLAFFVDREADDRGAVLVRERHHPVQAGALGFAVLEVRGVEDRLPAGVLQAGLDDPGLGRVEDERQRGLRREARRDLLHVDRAVAADVVDADVEHVCAFLHLLAGHLHARVPVALEHRVAELARAVRVGALADRQVRELLVVRDVRVDARATGLEVRDPGHGHRVLPDALAHRSQVLRGRAAATADDVDAELADEALVRVRQAVRREVVVRVPVDDGRQPRVRQAREERARVLLQIPEVLGHLGRSGRAVQAEDVRPHRFERRDRGADLRTDEHPARGLHRDLDHQRDGAARVAHRAPAGDDRRLGLQEVVDGLDEQDVRAALDEPGGLELVVVPELRELDGTERREPGAGPDGADDEARPVGCGELGRDLLRDAGRGDVQVVGDVRDPVLGEDQRKCPEGRSLDRIHTGLEVLPVHPGDQIGPGEDEVLVATLELRTAEVLRTQVLGLHPGSEGAVQEQDTSFERAEKVRHQGGEITAGADPSPPREAVRREARRYDGPS